MSKQRIKTVHAEDTPPHGLRARNLLKVRDYPDAPVDFGKRRRADYKELVAKVLRRPAVRQLEGYDYGQEKKVHYKAWCAPCSIEGLDGRFTICYYPGKDAAPKPWGIWIL